MNVLTVGLLSIAAYLVLMTIWLYADRTREQEHLDAEEANR